MFSAETEDAVLRLNEMIVIGVSACNREQFFRDRSQTGFGFLISQLYTFRLSIYSFSSGTIRVFPLRSMLTWPDYRVFKGVTDRWNRVMGLLASCSSPALT